MEVGRPGQIDRPSPRTAAHLPKSTEPTRAMRNMPRYVATMQFGNVGACSPGNCQGLVTCPEIEGVA